MNFIYYVTFKFTQRIQSSVDNELYTEFRNDYITISDIWKKTNTITGKTGKYIQSRTKGAGVMPLKPGLITLDPV